MSRWIYDFVSTRTLGDSFLEGKGEGPWVRSEERSLVFFRECVQLRVVPRLLCCGLVFEFFPLRTYTHERFIFP